jgi:hypothetical protein
VVDERDSRSVTSLTRATDVTCEITADTTHRISGVVRISVPELPAGRVNSMEANSPCASAS